MPIRNILDALGLICKLSLSLMLAYLSLPTQAQVVAATGQGNTCHELDQHVVYQRDHPQRPGQIFMLYRKSKSVTGCGSMPSIGHALGHKIAPTQPAFFLQARGKWMLLDEGTGPDQRQLQVWNMNTGKRVWRQPYSEPASFDSAGQRLHYWAPLATPVSTFECPKLMEYKAMDFRPQLQVKVILDLRNLTSTRTQETRCEPLQ